MALAVCLLFARRGDLLIRNLWSKLEEHGIGTLQSHTHGHHVPHLSYAVLLEWDLDAVRQAVTALPDGGGFTLSGQGAVVFPRGRVALAPAVPASVMARQESVIRALSETGALVHRHYLPGAWLPHVSLATRAAAGDLRTVTGAVADAVPVPLPVDRAALIDSSTGELWPLPHIP